jgi:predicted metal-dependent hydrolase
MFNKNLKETYSDLVWRTSVKAKRLSLRVEPKSGKIILTVPPRTLGWSIKRFVEKNRDWIAEKQSNSVEKMVIKDSVIIPYFGVYHTVSIQNHAKRTTEIYVENDTIIIKTSRADPTTNLKNWLIAQLKEKIDTLSHEKASRIDKKISKIDLRDTASRWGSCSSDGRLMFSWRLLFAPHFVLDYVVAHEVAHLVHRNHSAEFWSVLSRTMSDWPERKAMLERWEGEHRAL